MDIGQLDRVANLLDLVGKTADLLVGDVGDFLEHQFFDFRAGEAFDHQAGPGIDPDKVAGSDLHVHASSRPALTTRSSSAVGDHDEPTVVELAPAPGPLRRWGRRCERR